MYPETNEALTGIGTGGLFLLSERLLVASPVNVSLFTPACLAGRLKRGFGVGRNQPRIGASQFSAFTTTSVVVPVKIQKPSTIMSAASNNNNDDALLTLLGKDLQLWSPSLQTHSKAADVIANNKIVLLYFSASWCPRECCLLLLCFIFACVSVTLQLCSNSLRPDLLFSSSSMCSL